MAAGSARESLNPAGIFFAAESRSSGAAKDLCESDGSVSHRRRQSPVFELADVRKIDARSVGELPLAQARDASLFTQDRTEFTHGLDSLLNGHVDRVLNVRGWFDPQVEFFFAVLRQDCPVISRIVAIGYVLWFRQTQVFRA